MKAYNLPRLTDEVVGVFDAVEPERRLTFRAATLLTSYIYDVGVELAHLTIEQVINRHGSKVASKDVVNAYGALQMPPSLDAADEERLFESFHESEDSTYQRSWLESISSIAEGSLIWSDKAIRFFLLYLQILTEQIIEEVAMVSSGITLFEYDFEKLLLLQH